jgi:ABC-type molybdate transport system substrate-binding protein
VEGAAADVVILTGALIDELVASGHIASGSRADLGKVGTGVAVRAGTPVPDVSRAQSLRERLLAATRVVCPDPAMATAGKVVMQVLDQLGIIEQLKPKRRDRHYPNHRNQGEPGCNLCRTFARSASGEDGLFGRFGGAGGGSRGRAGFHRAADVARFEGRAGRGGVRIRLAGRDASRECRPERSCIHNTTHVC